ncbi:probable E3 ubiquitin-protein ligase HERC4 isoform X1 [Carassius auratus]|uniref:Probable E3 ubiquitin-protein ligase HERC4 isoform X1 n=1 Tax=Carassius auratus TaxID=7957 RepID=A0A6P6JTT5_CARAU|nr:probable E3 ubiquitin-protein ligase HERC4 isoform X1 [Carassius auratus]
MLCYWGAQIREGLGLVQPDKVKHVNCGIRSVCPKTAVQDMSAGRSFVGFVRDGKVSVLRLRSEEDNHDGKLKQLQLKNDRIRLIVCGGDGAVLLSDSGKVLIMDKSTVCRPLKGLDNRQVIQIACGDHHSMALTHDGQVFVWGDNSHGQLGLEKDHPGSPSAQHVKSLSGVPLAQISAGGDHSFGLSLSGVVFGWGKNSAGQLGLGDTTDRHVPTVVKSLNRKKTVSISCGGEHTATLSKGGTVFTFGSGVSGQLGHNSIRDEHHPRVVAELWGSEVSQVTCGRHHTLVSVASSKRIYSFGCGIQGQLENEEMIKKSVSFSVFLPTEYNHEYVIAKLIAGKNHSFALFVKELGKDLEPPKSNPIRGILTLNDRMIDCWLSQSDTCSWKAIKREINTVFSSTASLNGSFLKLSRDDHYQTSEDHCGLDFHLVKTSFAKLSENTSLISEVVKVVQQRLLPSLNPNPTGVEALRVYLLLPELIRRFQEQQRTELTEALASKILQLDPDARAVLETYWSRLPEDWLKNVVDLFNKESAMLIEKIAFEGINWDMPGCLEKIVQILHMVYKVCCNTNRNITKSDFIIHEINYLLLMLHAAEEDLKDCCWGDIGLYVEFIQYHDTTLNNLKSYPHMFNLEAKCRLLENREQLGCFELVVRRTALLEDCFHQLRTTDPSVDLRRYWLSVLYKENVSKRTDVNKKDFFLNVFKELCAPESQLLMYNDSNTMGWFPTKLSVEKEKYFLFGILCGLAFNNTSVVHLPFPLALFKKLLNVKPSLDDLIEFSPVLSKSLQYILDYSDDVEEMDMNFTVTWDKTEVELDPAEPGKMVTNYNRTEFVDKYVDYILNKSVEEAFEEFKRGFFKACNGWMVEMFEPEELRGVLVGNEEYDWDILKQNTSYEGSFYAEHPTVISFWEVFKELTPTEKKAFLLFLTGFEKVPILGMSAVKMRVTPLLKSTQDHLPQALTCHALLGLPVYQNKETLKTKLIEAINHKRGFWEE